MRFFYVANSNAAPFFSDTSTGFIEGDFKTAQDAMHAKRAQYGHPAGLYALRIYASADAYHEDENSFLVQWLSHRAEIRTNGIECPTCHGGTRLVIANYEDGIDIYQCDESHEWQVGSQSGELLGVLTRG